MAKTDKKANRIRTLFNHVNSNTRVQWEYVNQKGFDFSNDRVFPHPHNASTMIVGMN